MIIIERHFQDCKCAAVCVLTEHRRAIGGGRLLWDIISRLISCNAAASLVVAPHVEDTGCLPSGANVGATAVRVVRQADLQALGLKRAVAKGIANTLNSAGTQGPIILVLENASILALTYGMESVLHTIREVTTSGNAQSVLALFRESAHAPAELIAARSLATCEVLLKPVRQVQAEMIQASTQREVHIEAVATILRHSGVHWRNCLGSRRSAQLFLGALPMLTYL
jgi:hypothetical protein